MPLCTRMHRLQTVAKNVTSGTLACLSCIGLLAIIILLGASPFPLGHPAESVLLPSFDQNKTFDQNQTEVAHALVIWLKILRGISCGSGRQVL
jgi:hypothetical protein